MAVTCTLIVAARCFLGAQGFGRRVTTGDAFFLSALGMAVAAYGVTLL